MRLIDADALIANCQLAQKQADRHGREYANAFYSGGGDISTEWWCVEDMIENAPTIKAQPERTGKWERTFISVTKDRKTSVVKCSECGCLQLIEYPFCGGCGAKMKEDIEHETD